ncbi:TonB-dependent receptor, partial [Rhizobium brockwellii]|uniref:TonB-dependent receptor n=2 Tax=Alphaproteobacteria TaxID=28211 RepID=UPI003F96FA71
AVVSWKPVSSTLIYGSYARGYKAGGYNLERSDLTPNVFGTPTAASVTNLRFDPETVNAYELGMKFTSRTFTLNAAAFRSEFK